MFALFKKFLSKEIKVKRISNSFFYEELLLSA